MENKPIEYIAVHGSPIPLPMLQRGGVCVEVVRTCRVPKQVGIFEAK